MDRDRYSGSRSNSTRTRCTRVTTYQQLLGVTEGIIRPGGSNSGVDPLCL